MATNFGQMLAAAQAYATPEQQRALAQSESKEKEFEVEKEKRKQMKELQDLMEAELEKASKGSDFLSGLGGLGKLLSFAMPGLGAGISALSSAGMGLRQKSQLKDLMKSSKFEKYKGTWLSDPTSQYMKDVKGIRGDIDPLKTGLTTLGESWVSGQIGKGIGDELGGMFKGGGVDASGYSIDPTWGAETFSGGAGGPLKNLMANIKGGGSIGGGGLKNLFKDFYLMDILSEAGGDKTTQAMTALPYLIKLLGGEEEEQEFDARSYFQ